jgi:transposase
MFLEKLTDVVGLNLLEGRVVGDFPPRHRHQEFIQFLRRIQREFPGKTSPHLVMDNSGGHGTPEVKRCLKAHPCFVIHFVPASCSWLNLIERWFAELTNKRIRRGSFFSVAELTRHSRISQCLERKTQALPVDSYRGSIVAKLSHCKQTLEQIQPGRTLPKTRKRKTNEFKDTTLSSLWQKWRGLRCERHGVECETLRSIRCGPSHKRCNEAGDPVPPQPMGRRVPVTQRSSCVSSRGSRHFCHRLLI